MFCDNTITRSMLFDSLSHGNTIIVEVNGAAIIGYVRSIERISCGHNTRCQSFSVVLSTSGGFNYTIGIRTID
jgi:hypothetical protein